MGIVEVTANGKPARPQDCAKAEGEKGVAPNFARRAVFLDRDGVINRALVQDGKPFPPASVREIEILPGVIEACEQLRRVGYLLVVVTNQPDVARGQQSRQAVEAINAEIRSRLALDAIYVCYHDDGERCGCRKPAPGLLLQAAAELGIDLTKSFMVGDRWKDIEAGHRAGCRTLLVDYRYNEPQGTPPDYVIGSLAEAARIILNNPNQA